MANILTALLVIVLYICAMIRIAIELFCLYLLYKLVFDLIIPVVKTTKQVKQQFGEMNARMQEQMNRQQAQQYQDKNMSRPSSDGKKVRNDDYIDYEEVK